MAGFLFRQFSFHRSQIGGCRMRAMRTRLARKRRVLRRARRSMEALQVAAAEIEARNRRIRAENEIMFELNILADQLVYDFLDELEDDP